MSSLRVDEEKTLRERILASQARLKDAYRQEEISAKVSCPVKDWDKAVLPPHGGNCPVCQKDPSDPVSHAIARTNEAQAVAMKLYESLKKKNSIDLDGDGTDQRLSIAAIAERGKMFGVLLCVDGNGETQVLKAFSGQFGPEGRDQVPGWCPPVLMKNSDRAKQLERQVDESERDVEAAMNPVRAAQAAYDRKKVELEAVVKGVQERISAYKRSKAAENIAGTLSASEWAEVMKGVTTEMVAFNQDLADAKTAIVNQLPILKRLIDDAKQIARPLETALERARNELQNHYLTDREITNYEGKTRTFKDACTSQEAGMRGQTGFCAAPKLLAQAKSLGWMPISMAEFWMGGQVGNFKEKDFIPSCPSCRSFIGFSLCGLAERQKETGILLGMKAQ